MSQVTVNEAGVRDAIGAVIDELMDTWVREAKQVCPVRTGALRASISKLAAGPDGGRMSATMDYASNVEFGTHRQAAQPFIRSGLTTAVTLMRMGE